MPAEKVSQQLLLEFLTEVGPQELGEIALTTDQHMQTAKRKLDGLVHQGKLRMTAGEYQRQDVYEVVSP